MDRKLVVFDLDGTLFQSHKTFVQAIKNALCDCNLPVPDDDSICSMIGEQMEEVCAKLAPNSDEVQREDLGRQITLYEQELVNMQGTLFDGTEAMLEELKQYGYTLTICSNGKEEYLETVLSVCNIRRYFSAVKGKQFPMTKGERLQELLTEFSPLFAVMVGDRMHDFDAARENNIQSVGVSFGYGGKEVTAANRVARCASDIVCIVTELDQSMGITQ